MKVLVVSPAKLGVKHVVNEVLGSLVDDHEFRYVTQPTNPAPDAVEKVSLLSESMVERVEDSEPAYLAYAIMYFWLRAYPYVADVHDEFDAVWMHNPRLLPLAPNAAEDKLLVTYHNHLRHRKASFHDGPRGVYYRVFGAVERHGVGGLPNARYTVVYDELVEELRELGVGPERVTYVGNGVDVDRFRPDRDGAAIRDRYGVARDETVILSLGSLNRQKRPVALVEWFAALAGRDDAPDATLLVAGDGPRREAAERKAQESGLGDVQFLGFVDEDDKPDLYAAADYFAMPSRYEGESLALFEALASGLPCLVADISNLRFVGEESCGRVLDFDDPETAAAQAHEYLQTDTTDHAMNARRYATDELSWESRAEQYRRQLAAVAEAIPC